MPFGNAKERKLEQTLKKKKAETENKGRGNVAIWHRGTHLKIRSCK